MNELVVIAWSRNGDAPADLQALGCRGGSAIRVFVRNAPDPRTLGVFPPLLVGRPLEETDEARTAAVKAARMEFVNKLKRAKLLPYFETVDQALRWCWEHHGSGNVFQLPVTVARELWPNTPEVFYDPRELGWPYAIQA